MRYLSQDTVIYRPHGQEDILLCRVGDIMEALVDVTPSARIQREEVIGSPWLHQAARGNASQTMTLTPSRSYWTSAQARAWGLAIQETMALHPEGTITWLSCYQDGSPGWERTYHATVDMAHAYPLTSERDNGSGGKYGPSTDIPRPVSPVDGVTGCAWAAIELKLTLTGDIS